MSENKMSYKLFSGMGTWFLFNIWLQTKWVCFLFFFPVSCLTVIMHQMFDVSVSALQSQNIERNALEIASGLMMPFHTNGLHTRWTSWPIYDLRAMVTLVLSARLSSPARMISLAPVITSLQADKRSTGWKTPEEIVGVCQWWSSFDWESVTP